jgi:hypothetical protein
MQPRSNCRRSGWDAHESDDGDLVLIEQGGELGELGAQLIGDVTPLLAGGVGRALRESRGGRDRAGLSMNVNSKRA